MAPTILTGSTEFLLLSMTGGSDLSTHRGRPGEYTFAVPVREGRDSGEREILEEVGTPVLRVWFREGKSHDIPLR